MTEEAVVDASAILALLQNETFSALDPERVVGAWVNAVNLSEVLARLSAGGLPLKEAEEATAALDLRIVPFDAAHALEAARLAPLTRRAGLSLGGRACLATASARGAAVITADKTWAKLDLDLEILLIR
jgi:ribonuclease VapC